MTTVILGSNHFVNCQTIIAHRQHAVLQVLNDPLRLSLLTPPDIPSNRKIQVVDNKSEEGSDSHVRIVASDKSVAIFWEETPLIIATRLDECKVNLRVDLRPIGINIYDDASGLHIGTNTIAGNEITDFETVINLG